MMRLISRLALVGWLAFMTGCSEKSQQTTEVARSMPAVGSSDEGEAGHGHGEGPHGGVVADWGGGEYHVEFTVDHDAQEATVYVLGSNAVSPAPIEAGSLLLSISDPSFQVELKPAPLEGEANGVSSRFVGKNEKLGIVQEFSGTISGAVERTPYAGDFEEKPHGHEE